jgi:uncharacterized protein YndB with AHSA1/START domain
VDAEDPRVVEVEARISAAPGEVFPYLTDPEKYTRWKGLAADLDPRPGGVFRVQMSPDTAVRGFFVEVVPPRRVVFTWGWEDNEQIPPGSTTVEITLAPDGDGTILHLRHSGFSDDAAASMHREGWALLAPRLANAVVGAGPGGSS